LLAGHEGSKYRRIGMGFISVEEVVSEAEMEHDFLYYLWTQNCEPKVLTMV
jgi:hypothetical protein